MKIENINGMIKLTTENGKCLVQKGTEQTPADNNTTVVYLAKSLTPDDYEEKDKLQVEVNTDEFNEQIAGQMDAKNGLQA